MARKEAEVVVEEVEEQDEVQEVQHVVHHLDRRDSGTNWNESKQLPSLDD